MKKSIVINSVILIAGVLVASAAQVLLKKSALTVHENKLKEYLNWRVISGYGMMLASTLFSVYAYRTIPISLGAVLDATGYIFVTIFGVMFFQEHITRKRLTALMVIIFGILIYAVCG